MDTAAKVEFARQLIASGHSQRSAAEEAGLPESTLRYHLNGQSRFVENGDSALAIGAPGGTTDPDALMLELGIPEDKWDVAGATVLRKGDDPNYQLTLRLRRKANVAFVNAAVHVPPVPRPRALKRDASKPRLIAIAADQQAPYHDVDCHNLFLEFLDRYKPSEVVLAGDTIDLPDLSRHPSNPEWHVPAQECIDVGYRLLRDMVEAAPNADFHKLLGNHDDRIRLLLIAKAAKLYGLTPAVTPEEPVQDHAMSVRRLLHLDALGINLIQPNGNYTHAQHWIAPKLAVRHGWLTGAGTAEKSLKNIDYSMIVFHTHAQTMFQKTTHTHDGRLAKQIGVEGGAMCKVKGGIGYAVDPGWQQGFVTAWVWPDGRFQVDFARVEEGELFWGGERITLAA